MSDETLYRVTCKPRGKALGFSAGASAKNGKITWAAPILKYCVGHPAQWLLQYAELKSWQVEKVPMLPSEPEH